MPSFDHLFEQILATATSTVAQGQAFERLMVAFFRQDPEWKQRFSKVWLWNDWPGREGPDTGIDLVATETNGDGVCAIQCKAYQPHRSTLQKSDIDSFFTASGKRPFTSRVVVSTAKRWSRHAEQALENQQIPVSRLDFRVLKYRDFDWPDLDSPQQLRYTGVPKQLRPHQRAAVDKVLSGFQYADRGQLIMACGTGKTFTSLKLAEKLVGSGGRVLLLVPSIALLSQSMREWSRDRALTIRHRYLAVCSDSQSGKYSEDQSMTELAYPPKTDPKALSEQLRQTTADAMTVVFCTYQSLAVVHTAQQSLPSQTPFDLVISDEAHRTTGVDSSTANTNLFTRIHDNNYISARKRLYMTATPRLYSEAAKQRAHKNELSLHSMDDPALYGEELYRLDFSTAIEKDLLADYKVLILVVDTNTVAGQIATFLRSDQGLPLNDSAKLIGCWNALAKRTNANESDFGDDQRSPMRRALAFANTIKDSKAIEKTFLNLIDIWNDQQPPTAPTPAVPLRCELQHIDGTMGAIARNGIVNWLREPDIDPQTCRIVTNVRCLSEGVDVPALDAVIFTQPRGSAVEIVQSVGRVMRKAPGKRFGYVILPIAVPADADPYSVLSQQQSYRVVWEVLQALRAHDNRFDALINKLDLNQSLPPQIQVIGVGGHGIDANRGPDPASPAAQISLSFIGIEQWREAIYAHIIQRCGNRHYWEDWVNDVVRITQSNIARINALVKSSDSNYRELFEEFLKELRQNLNPQISATDAIEMLSQHLITKPVFDALFDDYKFTANNPVSKTMAAMLDLLDDQRLDRETDPLTRFYQNVRQRASGIDNPQGKQRILLELYEKFFAKAFRRDAERLGIVFTPVEIVDFILHSADHLLHECFGERLTNPGVHILDPFVGTGTFLARLLQSDLIAAADCERKYREELHANELVLLSYYIAAVNIEESYHQRVPGNYQPFTGIALTDTFQLNEDIPMSEQIFPINTARIQRQKDTEIRVIIGNPPYSAKQHSQNDANQNLRYPSLDARIEATYVRRSSTTNKNSLYDSYIRALRWACDRIGARGVIGFVTNGAFIDSNAAAGVRQCLTEECAQLYIYNLRGNARTDGEQRRKEKDNVFGQGSRLPIAITLLVKDPQHQGAAQIHYHDIGDYQTREQKLAAIAAAGHIGNLEWQSITPNPDGDWINQRRPDFNAFLALGCKQNKRAGAAHQPSVFRMFCRGVATSRDAWAYNYSQTALAANMALMIEFYNRQIAASGGEPAQLDRDPARISWTRALERDAARGRTVDFNRQAIRAALYRPFCQQYLYFDRKMNDMVSLQPQLFPEPDSDNRAIAVSGIGANKEFSALMVDVIPDLNLLDAGAQCFPRYYYPAATKPTAAGAAPGLLAAPRPQRLDNIPESTVAHFQDHYGDPAITTDAIFDYVYGLLHSPDYCQRFANDLRKSLPRIPLAPDFQAFSDAGRALAKLHLDYETAPEYPLAEDCTGPALPIQKLRFGGPARHPDRHIIVCHGNLTLRGIPSAAYRYQVNGKSAIETIIDRYQPRTDKASRIENDPNCWSDAPNFIPSLLKRIITISLESIAIIDKLPGI